MHEQMERGSVTGDPDSHEREWASGRPAHEIGEFNLIARLREISRRPNPALPLGIGDDAAILHIPDGWDALLTCDIQIEGRHFMRRWVSPEEAGSRAAIVNLSDIAAMGGLPVAALVSLGVPPALTVEAIERMYAGLMETLGKYDASIAGGNVTASEELILDVTLIGRVERGRALSRSGARAGDVVFTTGYPGRAAAALHLLRAEDGFWQRFDEKTRDAIMEARSQLRRFHAAPAQRIAVGRYLLENGLAHAAIDQSDGLAGDLAHICEESGVGIILEEEHLPVDAEVKRLAALIGHDPLDWVLGPSDDYELLFTAPPDNVDDIFAMGAVLAVEIAPIGMVAGAPTGIVDGAPTGRVESGPTGMVAGGLQRVALKRADGSLATLSGGWDHLRGRTR